MKKIKVIICMSILAILMLAVRVYAADASVKLEGSSTVKKNQSSTINVKISSNSLTLGVLSGKLEVSSNIELTSVTGKNGWSLTYNKSTGLFNVYNATGSKSAKIIEIKYKVKKSATTGKETIKISDANITTIDYETISKGTITKAISIKETEQSSSKKDTSKSSNSTKNTTTKKSSNKDSTVSNKVIPKTGKAFLINVLIVIFILVGIIAYNRFNKYKEV